MATLPPWLRKKFSGSSLTTSRHLRAKKQLELERLEDRLAPAGAHDITPGHLGDFATIQAAINFASPGDTILVDAGTYAEQVTINKSLTLEGAQHGVDAQTRSGAESIVTGVGNNGATPFYVSANNVTIDGFTIEGATNSNVFGFGIVLGAGTSGAHVVNDIVQNNIGGLSLANAPGGNQAVIQHNLFSNNNAAGPGSGDGIYTDQFNAGGTLSNVLIDSNTFTGQADAGLDFSSTDAMKPATGITISNNIFDGNARGLLAFSLTSSTISGNTFSNSTSNATADIRLFEGVNGLTITGNLLENGAGRAVRINNEGSFPSLADATNITFNLNSISGYTGPAGIFEVDNYTGTLNASSNWWGDVSGPTIGSNSGGNGQTIVDPGNQVTYRTWLIYGTDASPSVPGFQLPTTINVSAGPDVSPALNDYTRLANAIGSVQSGQTIMLSGTFDWSNPFAAAAFAKGNDGISGTADDYTIYGPANVNNVTITAASLGAATIQGPGSIPNVYLDGPIQLNTGNNADRVYGLSTNQNWTISNLNIFDFGLGIAMFDNPGGNSAAFSGTHIVNNHIRLAPDVLDTVNPANTIQNIGIYYSFGQNQVIQNNTIDLQGNGVSDSAHGNFSAEVGMQGDTSGGNVYDNFLIDSNTVNVLHAQSSDPELIRGIWENTDGMTSNITVSNNKFANLDASNNPALNKQVAFRLTSPSSATTTILYQNNQVAGAQVGFQYYPGYDNTGTAPVKLVGNTLTNVINGFEFSNAKSVNYLSGNSVTGTGSAGTGIAVGAGSTLTTDGVSGTNTIQGFATGIDVSGTATLTQSTITGNGTGVHVESGGSLVSASQNFITGNTGDGILVDAGAGSVGPISNNKLSGNGGLALHNVSSNPIDASTNWWGSNVLANVQAASSGPVDYTPFFDSGNDTQPATPGFQGDFSVLDVTAAGPQTGSIGRIQEGVNDATAGGTVKVLAGTYAENVTIDKSLTLDGAQAGQNAATRFAAFINGANGPKADPTVETVLTAPVNNPLGGNPNANDLIRALASNTTIDGLVIDGNNPDLTQMAGQLQGNGVNIDARRGITNLDANDGFHPVSNLVIQNNIIQNVAQRGINLNNNGTVGTGNKIIGNYIHDFGSDPVNGGHGIILFTNAYADVTNNTVVVDVPGEIGIQLQNFFGDGSMTWSGNNVTVGQDGIGLLANLFYAPNGVLNIQGNTVNAASGVTGTDDLTWGIYALSVQVGSTVNITDNTIGSSGGQFARGINLWNLPTTNTVTVSGGTVGNSVVGINLDSVDPFFGAGSATTVNVSNVAITGGTTGVLVRAATVAGVDPTTSVTANLTGVTVNGATTGVLVQGFSPSVTATASLFRSTITGSTTGVQVNANGALGTLAQNTAQNFITGNTTGIAIASGAGTIQPIFDNNLSGNTTAINNGTSTTLDASGNWWGSNTRAGVQGTISGSVDYTPFLNSGTDTQPATAGFQGDFSVLNVDSQSPQVGSIGRIQEGVNDVAAAGTVKVLAGTYAENVLVNKSVTLLGANNTNPVPGRSGPESIVEPGLTSSFDTSSIFTVTANNVTIAGFTIQGSIASPPVGQSVGFALTSGTTVYAAAGISNSSNVNTGGSAPSTTNISGLTVQNDIIQDFTQVGVYGDTSNGTVSTGNTIADNLITDVPNNGEGGYFGEGVIIYDNFYAAITGNKITKVRTGIQTGNNYLSSGSFTPSISSNMVSAYVKGIYYNLQYQSASPFTISNNTITQADASVSPAYNVGLLIQSIQGSVGSTIQGNNVSGFLYGVELAGNNTTSTVTVQGGTLDKNTYGVWATNNDYFYPANYDTTAALDGVSITNSTNAGIWVDSTSANSSSQFNTTNSVTLAVTDGTTIAGGPVGLLVDGALSLATLIQSTITANGTGVHVVSLGSLVSASQNFITSNTGDGILVDAGAGSVGPISNNKLSGNGGLALQNVSSSLIDASTNWWGSNVLANVQAASSGPVDFTPFLDSGSDTQPATPGFQGDFSILDVTAAGAQTGGTGRIQEGINDVTIGGTVNAVTGTYAENVTIDKSLTLAGVSASPTAVIINPGSGIGISIASPAITVTVKSLEITGAGTGLSALGPTTLNLEDLTLTGNGTGGTISIVTNLNDTPSSGATGVSITLTANFIQRGSDQAINYFGVANLNVTGSSGADTFNVTPSTTTTFTVHGGNPTPPASPGDLLNVNLTNASGAQQQITQPLQPNGFAGSYTFTNRASIFFDGIESLSGAPPTISPIADQLAAVSTPIVIPVTVGDPQDSPTALTVMAVAGNSTVGPQTGQNIIQSLNVTGSGANRILTITPITGDRGIVTVTVTVTDTRGLTASTSFQLTVDNQLTFSGTQDQNGLTGQLPSVIHSADGGAGPGTDVVSIAVNNPSNIIPTIQSVQIVADATVVAQRYNIYALNGYHNSLFGLGADWFFSDTTNLGTSGPNQGLYFLTPDGTLYAYNNGSTRGDGNPFDAVTQAAIAADGTPVAFLNPAYFTDPAPLLAQATVLPGTTAYALAQQFNLYSFNGYHQALFGLNADWFFSNTNNLGGNGPNLGLYFLTPDGKLYAYNNGTSVTGDGNSSSARTQAAVAADGTLVGTVPSILYYQPDYLASAGFIDTAYTTQQSIGAFIQNGLHETALGLGAHWLFSNTTNQGANGGLYFITADGKLYAYNNGSATGDGNPSSTQTMNAVIADSVGGAPVAVLSPEYYNNPTQLTSAFPPLPGPQSVVTVPNISQPFLSTNPTSGSITLSGYQGITGTFGVIVTVNDGVADSSSIFEVKVVDPHVPTLTLNTLTTPSVLTPVPTATTSHSSANVVGSYTSADTDPNETLSYSTAVVTEEHAVDQLFGLFSDGNFRSSLLGLNAKWFFSNTTNLGTNGPNQGLYFLTADGKLYAYNNGTTQGNPAADGSVVATFSPSLYNNPALLATGSASDNAYNAEHTLGLFESGGNFHQGLFGINAIWLFSSTHNLSNGGLYFILPDGSLHQWDGGSNAATAVTSPVVAQLNPSYYYDPTLLINATSPPPQPPAGVTAGVADSLPGGGVPGSAVDVTAQGYSNFVGTFGVETTVKDLASDRTSVVDYLVITTNTAPTFSSPAATPPTGITAGSPSITLQATDTDSTDTLTYNALVFDSATAALAYNTQLQINAFIRNGFHQSLFGLNAKWLFSTTSNLGTDGPNQGLYFITADGKLYAYNNGTATGDGNSNSTQTMNAVAADGTLMATLDPSYYADPTKLLNAKTTATGNTAVALVQSGTGGRVVTFGNFAGFAGNNLFVAASVTDGSTTVYTVIAVPVN